MSWIACKRWWFRTTGQVADAMLPVDEEKRLSGLLLSWLTDWMTSPDHIGQWEGDNKSYSTHRYEYKAKGLTIEWFDSTNGIYKVVYRDEDYADRYRRDPVFMEAAAILHAHLHDNLYPENLIHFPHYTDEREKQVAKRKLIREARLRASLAAVAETELLELDSVVVPEPEPDIVPIRAVKLRELNAVRIKGVGFTINYAVVFDNADVFANLTAREKMTEWLTANAVKGWYVMRHYVVFETEDDALLCRMSMA